MWRCWALVPVLAFVCVVPFVDAVSRQVTPEMTLAAVNAVFGSTADGDEVEFSSGTFTNACALTVSAARVTIFGAGRNRTILNCTGHSARHFHLAGADVLLRDVQMVGGFAGCTPSNVTACGDCQCGQSTLEGGNGGCMVVTSAATLRNVEISRCSSAWNGGGIALSSNSHLVLDGAVLSECHADIHGGALFVEAAANLSIREQSKIEDNWAGSDGGGIYVAGGRVSVKNRVSIERNSAESDGGAIAATSAAVIMISHDVHFIDNVCSANGGAVMVSGSALTASDGVEFHGNHGGSRGGAISVASGSATLSRRVNVTSNSAGRGAGLYLDDAAAVVSDGVSLRRNSASLYGGAWAQYYGGSMTLRDGVDVTDNDARWAGGAGYGFLRGSMLMERDVHVSGNYASSRGGAVYASNLDSITAQSGVVFDRNTGDADTTGCTLYVFRGTVAMSDHVVARNGECQSAGFLYASSATVHLDGVEISDMDTSAGWGGGLWVDNWSVLHAAQTKILRCKAFHGGGVAVKSNSQASFTGDVRIADNTATHNGGAIYSWIRISVTLQGAGVVLDNNSGRQWGGAIYVQEDATVNVLDGATIQNSGHYWRPHWAGSEDGIGGAVHAVRRANVILNGAVVVNNTARTGAAVDLDDHAHAEISNSRIEGNVALERGGAVNAYEGSTANIGSGSLITNNTARNLGGGVAVANDASVAVLDGAVLAGNKALSPRWSCPLPPCGGGAIQVGDVGRVSLTEGAVLRGNTADVGGGVLVMEKASLSVSAAELVGNSAEDGGGIAALNESSVTLRSATCAANVAGTRGGCLFHSGLVVQVEGRSRVESNTANDGGGFFLFSGMELLGTEGSKTLLQKNRAGLRGGAIELVGSLATMQINASHSMVVQENSAAVHGGGLAISLGAAVRIGEETCPNDCASSIRGDGVCQPQCMSSACNWDEGDCDAVMVASGGDGLAACDRVECSAFRQYAECHPSCWNASCDFHRITCQTEKARMRQCPLYDATVFAAVRKQERLVYVRGGNAGGYGRCQNSTCMRPDVVASPLNWTAGAVGPHAISTSPSGPWVVVPEAGGLRDVMDAVTVEAWVKVRTGSTQRGYVASWQHFGLFVQPFADIGFSFGLEAGGTTERAAGSFISGSGNWRRCVDGQVTTITEAFGLITDGIFDYNANMDCSFIIAPVQSGSCNDGFSLSITFHELDTEQSWDWVEVYDCLDAECTSKVPAGDFRYSGRLDAFTIVSTTGMMQVSLIPDQNVNKPGFVATFEARPAADRANSSLPGVFAAEEWHHVSASVDSDGTAQYYLDGALVHSVAGVPLHSSSFDGGFSVGQRYMGPELTQRGRFEGELDELRVWGVARGAGAADDWTLGCATANVTTQPGLLVCFGFDEGIGATVGNSVIQGSAAGEGVVGDKHLPWCVTKDDDGVRILDGASGSKIDLGVSWGFCSPEKPRLPGSSFEYDTEEMANVSRMTLPELLAAYPRCGGHPLQFLGNRALGGNGGAVYQADCDSAADARGLCFFTGMTSGGGGMTLASFVDNHASGAGGAAYVECSELGTSCDKSLALQLPWPLDDESQLKVKVGGNTAGSRTGAHSRDVATRPRRMLLPSDADGTDRLGAWDAPMQLRYVPGQTPLNLSVALVDALESLVVSTRVISSNYYVEALLCAVQASCSSTSALAPSTLHRFSRSDGDPMSRTSDSAQEVVCPAEQDEVLIRMSLVGAPEVPSRTVRIGCLPCEAGQSRQQTSGNGGMEVWRCLSCDRNQYVLDPNKHECQPCPTRAHCDGSGLWDDVEGSIWQGDDATGLYLLQSCPAGHQKVTTAAGEFSALAQQCLACTPGLQYIVDPNEHECRECPAGAICNDGSSLVGAVEGSIWEADFQDGIYRLVSCPAGHQLVNSVNGEFVELQQQCLQCTPGLQYIVAPNKHACRDCPRGAICDGRALVGAVNGSMWEIDSVAGIYRLVSCPDKHQLINSSAGVFSELAQQCQACKENIEYIVNPNTGACTKCPVGWDNGCDQFLDTLTVDSAGRSVSVNPEDLSVWEVSDGRLRLIECPSGTILIRNEQFPENDQCTTCGPETFSEGKALWYERGQPLVASLSADAVELCLECVEGAKCPGGTLGATKTGFWKNSSSTPAVVADALRRKRRSAVESGARVVAVSSRDVGVYPCPPHACVDGGCADGREGIVCGVCSQGWSMAYGTCTRCQAGPKATRPILAAVLLLLAAVALYIGGYIPIFGREPEEEVEALALPESRMTVVKAKVAKVFKASRSSLPFLGWGKIVISFYQVLSSYIQTFPVNWPVQHSNLMENSAVARFDFMAQPGLNCLAGSYTYREKIIVYFMILPTVLFVFTLPTLFVIIVGLLKHNGWNQHPRFQPVIHQFLWMTLFLIFIVYPTVSVVTLRSFNCQDIGEYGRKLTVDFSEDCPKDDRTGFIFVWSLFFTALYPAGIPVFFFIVLLVYKIPHMARAKIKEAMVAALIAQYKRRTATSLASNLQTHLGLKEAIGKKMVGHYLGDDDGDENTSGDPQAVEGSRLGRRASLTKRASLTRRNSLLGRRNSISKNASMRSVGSIPAETAIKGLAAAQVDEQERSKLKGLVEKYATPARNGQSRELDLETFNAMMNDLMAEQTQFSGLERLDSDSENKLTREQMKTLITFDWLRQNDSNPAERGRRLSVTDTTPTSTQAATPAIPRRRNSVLKNLKRRGSLFNTPKPEDPKRKELDAMSDEKLRNRVKDIADQLREARVIAIPHLEWNGDLGEEEQQAISHIGFLFKNYRVECWYYELLEIIRKLITTAVMSFIFPGSPAQVAVGFTVCLLFLMLAARLNPFVDHRLERMHIWALFALTMTLFYGMMLMIQEQATRPLSDRWMNVLSDLFMVINWSVLFYPLMQIYFGSRYAPIALIRTFARKYLRHVEEQRESHPDSRLVRAHDTLKKSASFKQPSTQRSLPAATEARARPSATESSLESPLGSGTNGGTSAASLGAYWTPAKVTGGSVKLKTATTTPSSADVLGRPQNHDALPRGRVGLFVDTDAPALSVAIDDDVGEPISGYTEFKPSNGHHATPQRAAPMTPQPEAFELQIAQVYYQIVHPAAQAQTSVDLITGAIAESAPGPIAMYSAPIEPDPQPSSPLASGQGLAGSDVGVDEPMELEPSAPDPLPPQAPSSSLPAAAHAQHQYYAASTGLASSAQTPHDSRQNGAPGPFVDSVVFGWA